jgi:hypothetical protein
VPVFEDLTGLQPGPLYHYRLRASNSAGEAVSQNLTFTTSLTTWQQWQVAQFGNHTEPRTAPDAAPDGDALSNLVEFALGSAPLTAGYPAAAPRVEIYTSPESGLTFPSIVYKPGSGTGFSITPEASIGLLQWSASGISIQTLPDAIAAPWPKAASASCASTWLLFPECPGPSPGQRQQPLAFIAGISVVKDGWLTVCVLLSALPRWRG